MMAKRLADVLAALFLLSAPALAQNGAPTLQVDRSGSTRCLYPWDRNDPAPADKGLPLGCIDDKGAWNLPPSLRNRAEIDETVLRGFGYVADGNSHPLSSVTRLNGRSTAGWSLAQWQAVLPGAQALSDEIDGAAINSVIQAATADVMLGLGPGTARLSHPIRSCAVGVTLRGAGETRTVLRFDAGIDGWHHCASAGDTPGAARIGVHDLALLSASPGNHAVGIDARYSRGAVGGDFDNVKLDNFNACMRFDNGGGIVIDHVWCNSGVKPGTAPVGNGIAFHGEVTFINHVTNALVQGYDTGYLFQAKSNLGLEDMALLNSSAGHARVCVKIGSDSPTYSPLQYVIDNFACQAHEGFVDAQQAAFVDIRGGTWILGPPSGTWSSAGKDLFNFCRVETGRLDGTWITNDANRVSVSSYVRLNAGTGCGGAARDVRVTNNKIEYRNLTATNGMIWKEAGSVGILARGNTFTDFFAVQGTPPPNAFNWSADASSAVFYANPGEIRNFSGSVAGVASTTAVNVASASLPPGIWSCSTNIWYSPVGGARMSVLQAGYSTAAATLPATPGQGGISQGGTWTAGMVLALPTYTFDFTTATASTNVYLVGLAAYTGGSVSMANGGQCVRVR